MCSLIYLCTIGMYSNILERHYKKGSRKGRFKLSESASKFWKDKYDKVVNLEGEYTQYNNKFYKKWKKNEKFGLRKSVRLINKLNTIEEIVDAKDYVQPIYKNSFIGIKSFIPRNSNKLKFKLKIPRLTYSSTGSMVYFRDRKKFFDSYGSAKKYADILEKEHVSYVKKTYEEYYKTHSYE